MKSQPLLRIAWRNVRKNWRHSLGSLLSIVVGYVAIVLFQGYLGDLENIQALWNEQRAMLGSVLVEKRGASSSEGRQDPMSFLLAPREQSFVEDFLRRHASEVKVRMRILQVAGLASAGRSGVMFVAWGHDVEEGARLRGPWTWNAVAGRPLQLAPPNSVLLGGRLGRLLDCQGPPVTTVVRPDGGFVAEERPFNCRQPQVQLAATTRTGQMNAVDPAVAGLFDAGLGELDSRFVLMPIALAQQLLDTDYISFYSVAVAGSTEDAGRFSGELNAAARQAGLDITATPWRQHMYGELYRRGMAVLGTYRVLVILVVVTIAGMSVFTSMLKAVNERVREIGALRSMGFRRRQVVRLFTLEGALLSAVSSLAGLGVGVLCVQAINRAGLTYNAGLASQPIPLTIGLLPSTLAGAMFFLSAVGVVAAFFPARRAARLPIADALRQV